MEETTHLKLPYILAAQSQKHVTHNEALRTLDAVVQLGVLSHTQATPPVSPADGDRYIVAAVPAGAWSGHAGEVAAWQDGAWAFHAPTNGWLAWVEAADELVVYDGASWVAASQSLNPAPLVGVNATADMANRLAVSSPAVLFNHAGAGQQTKINKAAAADTASVLFQTGFSGRAEMGLAGDDDFHFKVSSNGTAWHEAIVIDAATGEVTFPHTTLGGGSGSFTGPLTCATGPGTVFLHDASVNPGNGGYNFKLIYSGTPRSDGPVIDPVYTDDVWCWGINIGGAPGAKAVSNKAYGAWHLESKFYGGAIGPGGDPTPFLEHFFTFMPANSTVNYRPIAFVGTHDGSFQQVALASNQAVLTLPGGAPQVDFDFRTAKQISVYDGIKFSFLVNGSPVALHRNAANTASYALPYIDTGDNIAMSRPMTTPTATSTTKTAAGPTLKARGANTNALTVDAPQANSATMTFACATTQSASAALAVTCDGSTTATAAANAVTEADIGRTITGTNVPGSTTITDVISTTQFTTNNALPGTVTSITMSARTRRTGSVAVDAGGNIVFSQGANAGAMYFDHAGSTGGVIFRDRSAGFATRMSLLQTSLSMNVPVKLPSYTLAALPSASGAGAGAMAYVTDASGGPTLAMSNGTAWKVVAALGATVS